MVYARAGDKVFALGHVVAVQRHPYEREPRYGVTVRLAGGHVLSFDGEAAKAIHGIFFGDGPPLAGSIYEDDLITVIDLMPDPARAGADGHA